MQPLKALVIFLGVLIFVAFGFLAYGIVSKLKTGGNVSLKSDEFLEAMKYACELAKTESLGIILLYIIQDENFRHWKGVENIMRKEQEDQAKEVLNKYIKYIIMAYTWMR